MIMLSHVAQGGGRLYQTFSLCCHYVSYHMCQYIITMCHYIITVCHSIITTLYLSTMCHNVSSNLSVPYLLRSCLPCLFLLLLKYSNLSQPQTYSSKEVIITPSLIMTEIKTIQCTRLPKKRLRKEQVLFADFTSHFTSG